MSADKTPVIETKPILPSQVTTKPAIKAEPKPKLAKGDKVRAAGHEAVYTAENYMPERDAWRCLFRHDDGLITFGEFETGQLTKA